MSARLIQSQTCLDFGPGYHPQRYLFPDPMGVAYRRRLRVMFHRLSYLIPDVFSTAYYYQRHSSETCPKEAEPPDVEAIRALAIGTEIMTTSGDEASSYVSVAIHTHA